MLEELGGFDERFRFAWREDSDLYLRVARQHRIWCHDEFVAEYRQHETNTSRRPMLMMRSTLEVMRGQRAAVRGDARAKAAWRQGVAHWQHEYGEEVVRAIRKQLRTGDWRGALPALSVLPAVPGMASGRALAGWSSRRSTS